MSRIILFILCIGLLLIVGPGIAVAGDSKWTDPSQELVGDLSDWLKGPVQFIILPEEKDAFEELKTREERLRFIMHFWAKRDPDISNPENQYRMRFYQRVRYAENNFQRGDKGWRSSRGQILIVFGPPAWETKRSYEAFTRPVYLWRYTNLPSSRLLPRGELVFADIFSTGQLYLVNESLDGFEQYNTISRSRLRRSVLELVPSTFKPALEDVNRNSVVNPELPEDFIAREQRMATNEAPMDRIDFAFEPEFQGSEAGKVNVILKVSVKMADLTFVDEGEGLQSSFILGARLKDPDGDTVVKDTLQPVQLRIRGALEGMAEQTVQRNLELEVAPGSYILEILILPDTAGVDQSPSVYRGILQVPEMS